jgi:hypothetical protein
MGSLGTKPTVWAECLFADPIADIAVIGQPDSQELGDEADAYQNLLASTTPFLIADASKQGHEARGSGLVLSLVGDWVQCSITRYKDVLSIDPAKLVVPGMSGSPILSVKGQAIGVVSTGGSGSDLNAVLTDNLPIKFLPRARTRADRR